MSDELKKKYLKVHNIDDIITIEEEARDKYYNEILKDKDIKKHLCKTFNLPESGLNNLLIINGATPIDDFIEDK